MDTKQLEAIGLTKGEAEAYLALVTIGESTAGAIAEKTGMQRSTVYFCLTRLLQEGLASYSIKNKKRYYQAFPPNRLLEYLENKQKRINEQKTRIAQLLPQIQALAKTEKKQNARVFVGWKGIESSFSDVLKTLKRGESYPVIMGTVPKKEVFERFRRFIYKFHQKREKQGIHLQIIFNNQLRPTIGKDRKKQKNTEVRFVQDEYSSPVGINIYENKTLFALWIDEPIAFVIESEELTSSMRDYFNLIWSIAKE